ncbi:MAG: hypothetical protein QHH13_07380 [Melioribacter sp.]|uniref:hypothetical protein n=1 Tax=Rosettibacter primus TaxID=3111523 RepID=UPI00247F01EC|nr:hypothetical protein [Melioribacter sp.]
MQINFVYTTLVVIAFSFILTGCSKKNNDILDYRNLKFDKSKVAAEITDERLKIKFNPPINWQIKQPEFSRKVESFSKNTESSEKNFFYIPVYLFFNDSTKSLLNVGYVDSPDSSLSLNDKLNYYKNFVNNKYYHYNLIVDEFVHSNIHFTKFKYEIGNFINNKIILKSKNFIVTFDFTILKRNYNEEHEYMESTISSIKSID